MFERMGLNTFVIGAIIRILGGYYLEEFITDTLRNTA